jgi:hypothetical protein
MGWLTKKAQAVDAKLDQAKRLKGALTGACRNGDHQLPRGGRRKGNMIERTCQRCGAKVTTVDLAAAREQARKAAEKAKRDKEIRAAATKAAQIAVQKTRGGRR